MCFQRSIELYKSTIESLFHLWLKCKEKPKVDSYHWIISYQLDKRKDELACDDYQWIKPEIIIQANKVRNKDL